MKENVNVLLDGFICDIIFISMFYIMCKMIVYVEGNVFVEIFIGEFLVIIFDVFEYDFLLIIFVISLSL